MNKNQAIENDEMEIDLKELFYVLLKKWWLILLTALVGMALAIGITKFAITPRYQSQAMLYVLTKSTSITSVADLQIGTVISKDFEIIATSKPVLDAAIEDILRTDGIEFTRSEIKSMLTVTNEEDTRILVIQAVSDNPKHACLVANAVTEATANRMAEIMRTDMPTTVELAEVEKNPVSPSMTKNALLGFLAGALLVCGALAVIFLMNDNIKTEADVEKYLGETTLVIIPYAKNRGRKKDEPMVSQRSNA